uniref:Uncharacterized protein n=1 Tax=Meloidogyne enterolobii TaxID=390850 RepID=A0A6V7V8R0_MELEN|nr:unnamed protein product [Meloidogyne enterolobii]
MPIKIYSCAETASLKVFTVSFRYIPFRRAAITAQSHNLLQVIRILPNLVSNDSSNRAKENGIKIKKVQKFSSELSLCAVMAARLLGLSLSFILIFKSFFLKIMTSSKNNSSSTDSFDVLENEFDKAFVDLDVLIGEVEQENSELSFECRRRLTRISGIFVQFVHKVAIMNQRNCELEKDLQNSNNKLIGVLATNSLLEEQSEQLLLRVHSLSCQLYSKTAPHESEIIKKKLDKEMRMFNTKNLPITKSQAEISLLKEENLKLKSLLNSVHSEIYGARLAAKIFG